MDSIAASDSGMVLINADMVPIPSTLTFEISDFFCSNNKLTLIPSGLDDFLKRLQTSQEEFQRARIISRTALFKEELMREMWSPVRIQKRLDAGEDLESIVA